MTSETEPVPAAFVPRVEPQAVAQALFTNLTTVVRGKPQQVRLAIATVLGGGHLLIEDIPGVGKTLLSKALAASIGGSYRRVQGTPDLLPADLTGVAIYQRTTESFVFREGPLFANVVLVDEINRATPRTQAALLEAMEERHVTVDGETHPLPRPFVLVATQNPFEHAGTFPLVEGQRDRFATVLEMGLPGRDAERELLAGRGGAALLSQLEAVVSSEQLTSAIAAVGRLHSEAILHDYILDITKASREHPEVTLGASPRASLALLAVAKGYAVVSGRNFVTPDDVKLVTPGVLGHRLILSGGPDLATAQGVVSEILSSVTAPPG